MGRTDELKAFGPGKVILLGEHGVVYGHPAIAAPLAVGVTAFGQPAKAPRLDVPSALRGPGRKLLRQAFEAAAQEVGAPPVRVSLHSDLPTSMGLGSSAAVSVACARLLLQASGRSGAPAELSRVAWVMERVFHGTPSGVDHTCSARGELIHFRRKPGADRPVVRTLQAPRPLQVVVALAGDRPATKQTVAALRERQARWPQRYARIFTEIGRLADEGARAVVEGDLDALGDLMNVNQGLLGALGLSSPGIEALVYRLRALGAKGAKLTGAGGDGGAVIGLFERPAPVVARLTREGIRCFSSPLPGSRNP